jgi:anti-anti-sigma factor
MSITVETKGTQQYVTVVGELTVFTVSDLWQALWQVLKGAGEVEIDLGGVSDIDTAGIQLLMVVKMIVEENDQSVRFVNHSKVVVDGFECFDLAGYFGDPLVLQSEKTRVLP